MSNANTASTVEANEALPMSTVDFAARSLKHLVSHVTTRFTAMHRFARRAGLGRMIKNSSRYNNNYAWIFAIAGFPQSPKDRIIQKYVSWENLKQSHGV